RKILKIKQLVFIAGVASHLLPQPLSVEAFMRLSRRILMPVLLMVILGTQLAYAQNPKKQLMILSTSVDRTNQTLTVQGSGFGAQAPQVWCETFQMTVISATDTQLVVFLPSGVPDGTHLLTISRGSGEKDTNTFDMHVGTTGQGTVGPAGPQGPVGTPGPGWPPGAP